MTNGVNELGTAQPVQEKPSNGFSDSARANFERLEKARDDARERANKAEMEAALLKQRLEIQEQRNIPQEKDPLEGVDDYVDPARLKAVLDQERKKMAKEADIIVERRLKEFKQQEQQHNHMSKLRNENRDYDDVMNEKNIVAMEQTNPEFVQSLLHIQDDYERKKLAYNYLKRNKPVSEPQTSIREKVEENARNPYHIPSGSGVSSAVDYDLKSPQSREAAYAKLKAAQRNPIGSGINQR